MKSEGSIILTTMLVFLLIGLILYASSASPNGYIIALISIILIIIAAVLVANLSKQHSKNNKNH
ncbi:hypothetical protein BU607_00775 [Staphylococcus auricularis]|uniref:Uncharacterized protein n=1 Tax=Staphylococcus auricularis TaxID=29379 RepID=A0ABX5IIR2_9STAP|nr:hypothetical protein BU607_00775 [Staphylococcus auricularis]PTH25006.1 hypothetical protein BU608_08950 [Staphylococcus auricularis]